MLDQNSAVVLNWSNLSYFVLVISLTIILVYFPQNLSLCMGDQPIHNQACRQPSDESNASQMLQILDLISLARLASCER